LQTQIILRWRVIVDGVEVALWHADRRGRQRGGDAAGEHACPV